MIDPRKDARWRAQESRRMVDDARALMSFAHGLKEWDVRANDPASQERDAPPGAVLVHAMTLLDGEALPRAGHDPVASPILILVDDSPVVPDFLPEQDVDLVTEDTLRGAIARHMLLVAPHTPAQHHILDLVESIQDAVIVIDRARDIVHLNTSAISLLQTLTRSTGPFVGSPLAHAFPAAASATLRPAIDRALLHADASRVEEPERRHGLALDIAVFPNPDGATLLVRDITRRKDMEAELIETRVRLARAESHLAARGDIPS